MHMSNHVIKLILGLNLLLLITSCKRNNDGVIMQIPLRTVDCNINEAKKLTYFSEVCDSIIVIPLKDSNLIGFVDIIHLDDSGIYLTSNNILYAFNWAGDELYCLDRKGRASFDYLEIGDFAISNDYLVISDPEGKKILLFDKNNGSFLKSIYLDFYPERIAFLNEKELVISCGGVEGPKLVSFNVEKEVMINHFLHFERLFTEPLIQTFTIVEDKPLYRIPFYNDYYAVTEGDNLEKAISFDFKEKNFDEKGLKTINLFGANLLVDSKGSANIINVFNVQSMFAIYFTCPSLSDDSQFLMLVNTLDNSKCLFDSETYIDDVIFYDHVVLPLFYDCYKDYYASVLYPDLWTETFNNISEDRKTNKNYLKALALYPQITRTENPSIVLYHLKAPK